MWRRKDSADRFLIQSDPHKKTHTSKASCLIILKTLSGGSMVCAPSRSYIVTVTDIQVGVRFLNRFQNEAKLASDALYFGLTTLLGNRTLGEEYCDIVQIEDRTRKLPSFTRRAGYILTSILLPYALTKSLPRLREQARQRLERNPRKPPSKQYIEQIRRYALDNLETILSPSLVYAVSLAFFYFSGAYYQLGKRVWGLRYIFTKKLGPGEKRVGYEVLGVLLVAQMVIQSWLHANKTWQNSRLPALERFGGGALVDGGVELSFDPDALAEEDGLVMQTSPPSSDRRSKHSIEALTHTPTPFKPNYDFSDPNTMKWMEDPMQRRCILCLEDMTEPAVTTCGHMFCYSCITACCREKPECPLCRQMSLPQHILPLRG
jgi:peroxin-10